MRLKSQGSIPNLSVFVGQNSILRHYCTQTIKDGMQIRVYKITTEKVTHFSQLFH